MLLHLICTPEPLGSFPTPSQLNPDVLLVVGPSLSIFESSLGDFKVWLKLRTFGLEQFLQSKRPSIFPHIALGVDSIDRQFQGLVPLLWSLSETPKSSSTELDPGCSEKLIIAWPA